MMLEVLAGCLDGMNDVVRGEQVAMETGDTDQQAFHQSKLRGEHGKLPAH